MSTNPKNKFDLFLQGTVIVTLNSKYGLYEFNTCLINTTPWFIEFFFNNVLDLSNVNILQYHFSSNLNGIFFLIKGIFQKFNSEKISFFVYIIKY